MNLDTIFNKQDGQSDPFAQFGLWLEAAGASEPDDPNAFALATSDNDGMPNARMLLLKAFDNQGFVFYTNLESAKGQELTQNPQAAMLFHWKSLGRQVRARGSVAKISDAEADDYFQSRPRGSRIGAWASKQSQSLESRFALEKLVAKYGAKYAVGDVPRPKHWSGFRLAPIEIEFWKNGAFRLHDRVRFTRSDPSSRWNVTRLYP